MLALLGSWRIILDMFGDLTILAQAVFIVIMVVLGYFISKGDSSIRKGTGLLEIGSNSGPVFAAIAIAFNNDPEILGITTVLVFVQIVVGTLISAYMGKGDGEEGAPAEAPAA